MISHYSKNDCFSELQPRLLHRVKYLVPGNNKPILSPCEGRFHGEVVVLVVGVNAAFNFSWHSLHSVFLSRRTMSPAIYASTMSSCSDKMSTSSDVELLGAAATLRACGGRVSVAGGFCPAVGNKANTSGAATSLSTNTNLSMSSLQYDD